MKIIIREVVIGYIKAHANMNKGNEIFGWLIGSEDKKKGNLFVECAISSHRYMTQNVLAAEPDLTETGIISTILPAGLSIIGMYHSHPANVFHSSIDDRTLQQLTVLYPRALSVVTNGDVFTVYHLEKSKQKQLYAKEMTYKISKGIENEFRQLFFEFQGYLYAPQTRLQVNDIIAATERQITIKLDKMDIKDEMAKSLKNKDHNILLDLGRVYPVGMEETRDNYEMSEISFNFKTVIDVSKAFLENKDSLQQRITNSLRTCILAQLKSLKINKNRIEITEKRGFFFQDIPLHVYLDPYSANTPMYQFMEDMVSRSEIMKLISC
ncbi:MAG: Mov34/MPN/PAD-1 family protein [Candidatus Odinarchaeota archaeon]